MELGKRVDWEDVESVTDGFSDENFIDYMQFGKVYKGTRDDGQDVTVKLLSNEATRFTFDYPDMIKMVEQELAFLELQQNCPFFAKPIGYSFDSSHERLAVVYDLKPIGTLHNLLKTDDALDWRQRMNVALRFARSLAIMHSDKHKCYVRNIDAAHIILDQYCNPLLIEFSSMESMIRGVDMRIYHVIGSLGYADPDGTECGYVDREDVFAFGVVLISLVSKRIWDLEGKRANPELPVLYEWAVSEERKTLVHESFKEDQGFNECDSIIVSQLALQCAILTTKPGVRPTMAEVVSRLEHLSVFRGV